MNVVINRLSLAIAIISITCKGSSSSCDWTVTQTKLKRFIPCVGHADSQCTQEQAPALKKLHPVTEVVEKPSSIFSMDFQYQDESGNLTTGLNISWTPPQSANSLHRLEGFFLRLTDETYEDDLLYICRVFIIENITLEPTDRTLVFNYDIYPVPAGGDYKIEVFSLPWQGVDGDNAVVSYVSTQTVNTDYENSSSEWLTTIHYKLDKPKTVEVTFQFAQRFQLDQYVVELIDLEEQSYKEYIKRSEYPDKQFARVTFKDIEPGTYFIAVQPIDANVFDPNRCVCYKFINQAKKCEHCGASTTNSFVVSNKTSSERKSVGKFHKSLDFFLPRKEVKSKDRDIDSRFMTKESRPDHETGKEMSMLVWIMIVVCVALAVTFISTLIFIVWKRQTTKRRKQQESSLLNEINVGVAKNTCNTDQDGGSMSKEPQKKTLLLLNAEDHPLHVEAVKQFLNLLQDFCHCTVIYPPHCLPEISQTNWKDWILKCLDKVDNVVIVNSEAAFKIMKASRKNETYKNCSITATGHLFKDFLHEIIKEFKQNQLVEKYLLVSFDHTSSNFCLKEFPSQQLFVIPKQLSNMVRNLHQLMPDSEVHPILESVLLGKVADTESGLAFTDVVSKAMRYEKSNVIWFSERFGHPYNRKFFRNDSGFSSVDHDENDDYEMHVRAYNRTVSFSSNDGRDELGFYPPDDYIGSLRSLENTSDFGMDHGDLACMKHVLVGPEDENHLAFQPDQSLAILEETDETNVYTSDSEFSFFGENDVNSRHFVSPVDLVTMDDLSVSISTRLRQINEESSKF